jgi:hypothetical protein
LLSIIGDGVFVSLKERGVIRYCVSRHLLSTLSCDTMGVKKACFKPPATETLGFADTIVERHYFNHL